MPRPKVHPSQRQRAAEACNFCRTSKKRCSGTVPCNHCQRRGIADSCYLTHRPRGSRYDASAPPPASNSAAGAVPPPDVQKTSPRPAPIADQSRNSLPFTPIPPPDASPAWTSLQNDGYIPLSPPDSRLELQSELATSQPDVASQARLPRRPSSPSTTREPHPRMLLNSRGERVFIGGASAISFLQLIREIVAENIGPSQFSHNDKSGTMLETQSPEATSNALVPAVLDLGIEQKLLYSRVYSQATEGLINIFSSSEIEGLLSSNNNDSLYIKACKRATIELIIAIGAQCQSPSSAEQVGQPYFQQAQRHAFSGMLEDPNVDMVRAFILMAFYMLGECRRNSAFMYLGVATRAAVALGLHSRDSYTDMNSLKYQLRLRIWLSLCILDMLVSTILGRPSATAALRSDLSSNLDSISASSNDSDTELLIASYKILEICNDAVDKVYEKKEISTSIVVQLLNDMESWSKSLPESLRNTSSISHANTQPTPKGTIGKIYVSCIYYFAVTLVTRPILISALTDRSGNRSPPHSQLASACLDAAVYLVQTCNDAYKANLLLGNMCIMKALLFAAGLILGFEIFAKREMDYGIETAFRGARDVLEFLAIQSPQAAHYYEILTLLSNAIDKQRDKTLNKARSKYVSRILPVGSTQKEGASMSRGRGRMMSLASPSLTTSALSDIAEDEGVASVLGRYMPLDQEGEVFLGWDSLDLSQWDNFPFLEPLSPRSFDIGG